MVKKGKTTYILGAGASVHAGYPLIKTMGAQLLAWMRIPRENVYYDFARSADSLQEIFGDNIEEVFNGIRKKIDERHPGHSVFADHRSCLVQSIREWFAEIHRQQSATAYARFAAEVIKAGDTLISFNYDVGLDSKLRQCGKWTLGDGYGFRVQSLPTG